MLFVLQRLVGHSNKGMKTRAVTSCSMHKRTDESMEQKKRRQQKNFKNFILSNEINNITNQQTLPSTNFLSIKLNKMFISNKLRR